MANGLGGDPIRELAVDLRRVGVTSRVKARKAIQKTCADSKSDMQALAAVDTGAMRASVSYETHSERDSIWGEVGPTVDYAIWVETGTSRMAPQPFVRPAFDRRAPILELMLDQLKVGELE